MKNVLAFILLWACLLIQSTIFQITPINVIQPNFILVMLIGVALARGPKSAMFLGVLIGLVQDAVFGSFLGLNAFTYGVLGYFSGAWFAQFLHRNIAVTFLITVIATFIQQWFTFGLTRMFDATAYTWSGVMAHSLSEMIQNGLLLLLLYPAILRLFGVRTRSAYAKQSTEAS